MDISKYYAEICKNPFLTAQEEAELFTEYYDENTSTARKAAIKDRIIKANLRFAFNEARKRTDRADPELFSQLISAANEGLIVGFEKFTPGRGRFNTYAGWWVLQRILNEKSRMRIVSLPVWKQQLSAKIEKLRNKDENISLAEVKKHFPEKHHKDVEELYNTRYLTFYLEDLPGASSMPDTSAENTDARIDMDLIMGFLDALPDPHCSVIRALYGFEDETKIPSATALASRLGITKEKLNQIKREALDILRTECGVNLGK